MIGTHYEGSPVPPVPEHTRYVGAGALSIGVEYRQVDASVIAATYGDVELREAGDDTPQPPILDDRGLTLHVCDAATGDEYLRFDVFEDNPHYHYIHPRESHLVVPFDRNENCDRFSDGFCGGITKDTLSGLVPTCNDAVEAFRYD